MSKGLAMRRAAAASGIRVIDALQLPEVQKALQKQMGVECKELCRLEAAAAEVPALRKELTERTNNVRRLADQLKAERERGDALREELSQVRVPLGFRRTRSRRYAVKSFGVPSGSIEFAVIAAALALLLMATLHH